MIRANLIKIVIRIFNKVSNKIKPYLKKIYKLRKTNKTKIFYGKLIIFIYIFLNKSIKYSSENLIKKKK